MVKWTTQSDLGGGPELESCSWAIIILLVTTVAVLVTFAMSHRVLTTYRGKVIDQRYANPCKEGNGLARRHELEGVGTNPCDCK